MQGSFKSAATSLIYNSGTIDLSTLKIGACRAWKILSLVFELRGVRHISKVLPCPVVQLKNAASSLDYNSGTAGCRKMKLGLRKLGRFF